MSRLHQWKYGRGFEKNSRYCTVCRLSEVVRSYRYLSPRYGYKMAKRHLWYKLAKHIAYGTKIPLPCDLVSINPPEVN